jgi:DNA-binding PadR family transcriptional regulator
VRIQDLPTALEVTLMGVLAKDYISTPEISERYKEETRSRISQQMLSKKLRQFNKMKWIDEIGNYSEETGRHRKYYKLTPKGVSVFAEVTELYGRVASLAERAWVIQ